MSKPPSTEVNEATCKHLRICGDATMNEINNSDQDILTVFATPLGWMAILGSGETLKALTFGHESPQSAIKALDPELVRCARRGDWNPRLVERLRAYASGRHDDFRDVEVDLSRLTPFRRRVVQRCRHIPPGKTLSYGKLASLVGSPRAARAVGSCMAANRVPLVIPCHRVVGADGSLHGFSASGGLAMKQRLLEMEAVMT